MENKLIVELDKNVDDGCSPCVREFVANFEKQDGSDIHNRTPTAITKSKVSQIKEALGKPVNLNESKGSFSYKPARKSIETPAVGNDACSDADNAGRSISVLKEAIEKSFQQEFKTSRTIQNVGRPIEEVKQAIFQKSSENVSSGLNGLNGESGNVRSVTNKFPADNKIRTNKQSFRNDLLTNGNGYSEDTNDSLDQKPVRKPVPLPRTYKFNKVSNRKEYYASSDSIDDVNFKIVENSRSALENRLCKRSLSENSGQNQRLVGINENETSYHSTKKSSVKTCADDLSVDYKMSWNSTLANEDSVDNSTPENKVDEYCGSNEESTVEDVSRDEHDARDCENSKIDEVDDSTPEDKVDGSCVSNEEPTMEDVKPTVEDVEPTVEDVKPTMEDISQVEDDSKDCENCKADEVVNIMDLKQTSETDLEIKENDESTLELPDDNIESIPTDDPVNLSRCSDAGEVRKIHEDGHSSLSVEELEYNNLARIWVSRHQDNEISRVIFPPAGHQDSMEYVCKVFHGDIGFHSNDGSKISGDSAENLGADVPDNILQEDVLKQAQKKLESLNCQKKMLMERIVTFKSEEEKLNLLIKEKLECKWYDKHILNISEQEKVMQLLTMLSGRLARTHNMISDVSSLEQQKINNLKEKYKELEQKFDDAKILKNDIDSRRLQISGHLEKCLSSDQYKEYEHLITEKFRLSLEQNMLDDRIKQADEQIRILLQHV